MKPIRVGDYAENFPKKKEFVGISKEEGLRRSGYNHALWDIDKCTLNEEKLMEALCERLDVEKLRPHIQWNGYDCCDELVEDIAKSIISALPKLLKEE